MRGCLWGGTAWTRLRWRRRVDVESSRVGDLSHSFLNSKKKIQLEYPLEINPFRPNDFNRLFTTHCVLL